MLPVPIYRIYKCGRAGKAGEKSSSCLKSEANFVPIRKFHPRELNQKLLFEFAGPRWSTK
jgi:hypothetical protein